MLLASDPLAEGGRLPVDVAAWLRLPRPAAPPPDIRTTDDTDDTDQADELTDSNPTSPPPAASRERSTT